MQGTKILRKANHHQQHLAPTGAIKFKHDAISQYLFIKSSRLGPLNSHSNKSSRRWNHKYAGVVTPLNFCAIEAAK